MSSTSSLCRRTPMRHLQGAQPPPPLHPRRVRRLEADPRHRWRGAVRPQPRLRAPKRASTICPVTLTMRAAKPCSVLPRPKPHRPPDSGPPSADRSRAMSQDTINGQSVEVVVIGPDGKPVEPPLTPRERWTVAAVDQAIRSNATVQTAYPGATLQRVDSMRGVSERRHGRYYLR